jgi:hypothetical protein
VARIQGLSDLQAATVGEGVQESTGGATVQAWRRHLAKGQRVALVKSSSRAKAKCQPARCGILILGAGGRHRRVGRFERLAKAGQPVGPGLCPAGAPLAWRCRLRGEEVFHGFVGQGAARESARGADALDECLAPQAL